MALEKAQPTDAHLHVLQLLSANPISDRAEYLLISPSSIGATLRYQANYVGQVCQQLAEYDLIEKADREGTYYRITWRGRAYLEGEVEIDTEAEDTTDGD